MSTLPDWLVTADDPDMAVHVGPRLSLGTVVIRQGHDIIAVTAAQARELAAYLLASCDAIDAGDAADDPHLRATESKEGGRG